MTSPYLIYALADPWSHEWRYIGKSCSGTRRCRRHYAAGELSRDRTHKGNWIRACLGRGRRPAIVIVEELASAASASAAEREWIEVARASGVRLTNATDGGEGTPGRSQSDRERQRRSLAMRGRPKSPDHIAAMRAAQTPEVRARKSSSASRTHSAEHNARVSASWTPARRARVRLLAIGRTHSDEARARMSASKRALFSARSKGLT